MFFFVIVLHEKSMAFLLCVLPLFVSKVFHFMNFSISFHDTLFHVVRPSKYNDSVENSPIIIFTRDYTNL